MTVIPSYVAKNKMYAIPYFVSKVGYLLSCSHVIK